MINSLTASVIIRTYNEAQYIEPLLKSIRLQTLQNIEIILVDSESTDDTVEIASKYCDKIVDIKKSEFTFGYSLNKGIEQAAGEYLILVSAHTLPSNKQWIEQLIQPLNDPSIAMVYGKQIGDFNSRYPEYIDLLRTFKSQSKILKAPNYFSHNANASLRKSFWEYHQFDAHLSGQEDIEWAKHWMQQGFYTFYQHEAVIIHSHRETWAQIRHRFKREKQAMISIGVHKRTELINLVFSELYRVFDDLRRIKIQQDFIHPIRDIFIYRWNKILGSFAGCFTVK
ncbi:MAG: hypothetical protein CMF45_00990 [Legionellales bacterium]|nr:hypothetical protein [Legionellales bacterium]|tara:strand:- start:3045 stop:3893 length:849 start_codon:yes stop_codon:yes gene_type:complete